MVRISSTPHNLSTVLNYVEQLSTKYRVAPDQHFEIMTCVTEAVNNAIVHGNKCDCSKIVEVRMLRQRDGIAVHVTDQGKGFDAERVPDPTSTENRMNIGGRGVYIMRQLSNRLKFLNNGSTVEMHFRV
jgi:serine/threonine-protein kinase RsbW